MRKIYAFLLLLPLIIASCNKNNIPPSFCNCHEPLMPASLDSFYVDVQTVVTPNGDGFNDILEIQNRFPQNSMDYRLTVYDKDGSKLNNDDHAWDAYQDEADGKLNDGPYLYKVEVFKSSQLFETFYGNVCVHTGDHDWSKIKCTENVRATDACDPLLGPHYP